MDYTSGGAPAQGYLFPLLKPAQIQLWMSDLDIEVSLDELQDPAHHKEKLRKLFTILVRLHMFYRCCFNSLSTSKTL